MIGSGGDCPGCRRAFSEQHTRDVARHEQDWAALDDLRAERDTLADLVRREYGPALPDETPPALPEQRSA